MSDSAFVKRVDCTKADEFLDNIAPRGPVFRELSWRDWVFRGVDSVGHKLVPSALRKDDASRKKLRDLARLTERGTKNPHIVQMESEASALSRFLWMADTQGLAIPEDTQSLRSRLQDFFAIRDLVNSGFMSDERWPPPDLWSLMALAQHYGMPTRLLDWTRSSFAGAYFAARKPAKYAGGRDGRLAVWALDMVKIEGCIIM